eukprot:CAMPEP_0181300710 /NCGR_PEP_ID=MMETSP1101-20121128/7035_1 /TAXON_ID=46948 /ORGANISM="Rhodomonas abbreviata, Strain Caron Lab Isolate" /LENGTH=75 /DNA_ID=CAMNT_0023405965 /DNA_START=297 /DNA_END=521 /DNA_ORIENTATION=-
MPRTVLGSRSRPALRQSVVDSSDDIANTKDLQAFDGDVVHFQGPLYEVRLEDHEFQFSRRGVKLERVVEMYQWVG